MSRTRTAVAAFALARIAFGAGLLARPDRVASPWLGKDAERPGTQVAVRGLGARDVALSAGALASLTDRKRLSLWLAGAALSDIADLAGTLAAPRDALPRNGRWGTVVLAGGSAGIGAGLIVALWR